MYCESTKNWEVYLAAHPTGLLPVSWESLHVHSCADSERCTTGCDLWQMRGLVLIKCASPQTRGMKQQSIAFCCSVFIQPPTPPCRQRYLPHQPRHKSSGKGAWHCVCRQEMSTLISQWSSIALGPLHTSACRKCTGLIQSPWKL